MPTIAEIRTQYPQYNDMSDDALAGALHQKFYSDIPRQDFDKKIGFQSAPQVGYVEDVAKSIPSGLAKGVAGIAGFPDALGRGIQYLEQKLSGENDQQYAERLAERKKRAILPDVLPTTEQAQGAIEKVTGPLYEPQTLPGKLTGKAAEFVPGAMLGPGGVVRNALVYGALPGFVSEAGGQAAEGTSMEGPARIVGGLAAPLGVAGARRVITPLPVTAERQAQNATMAAEGVPVTAGQRTNNARLKYLEAETGAPATTAVEQQKEAFTAAMLRRAGETANRASPEVVNRAFDRIGGNIETLSTRNNLHGDAGTVRDLTRTWGNYTKLVPETLRAPIVEGLLDDITNGFRNTAGVMDGATYSAMRSQIGTKARETANPELQKALYGIVKALDNTMERSIARHNPADLGSFREARTQYRNLIPIANAAEGAGGALLSPEKMRQTVISSSAQGGRDYVRGRGDFSQAVHAGNETMKALPQSGTSPRLVANTILSAPGMAVGYGQSGGDPTATGLGGLATLLGGRFLMGRGVMSRPVQSYLGNQILAPSAVNPMERLMLGVPSTIANTPEALRLTVRPQDAALGE